MFHLFPRSSASLFRVAAFLARVILSVGIRTSSLHDELSQSQILVFFILGKSLLDSFYTPYGEQGNRHGGTQQQVSKQEREALRENLLLPLHLFFYGFSSDIRLCRVQRDGQPDD